MKSKLNIKKVKEIVDKMEELPIFIKYNELNKCKGDDTAIWKLVYSMSDIEESSLKFVEEFIPKLLSATTESEYEDVIIEVKMELQHMVYHICLVEYFKTQINWWEEPMSMSPLKPDK